MINKRLIKMVPDAISYVYKNVICQVLSLSFNIVMMFTISFLLSSLINGEIIENLLGLIGVILICIIARVTLSFLASMQNYKASKSVKTILRSKIYDKVIKIGAKYNKKLTTAELLQVSVEGVEQLETYFGSYLSQFFYSMIAPVILFCLISLINFKIALILFICVPLIPISIMLIQKFAKKLLSKYWGEYTGLADNFLENLQGLNTLKIYSSDDFKHKQMNKQAERFRIITMKVLSMQLNSIIVMDIVAYGGAALGIILSLLEFSNGDISLFQALAIMLLSADFFLPLRLLGSFFHIAMNGIAASKKIFDLLDLEVIEDNDLIIDDTTISIKNLNFSYDDKKVLKNINMSIEKNSFVSIVGKSGCGKSTIAGILTMQNEDYEGSVKIGNNELSKINKTNLRENITIVSANSYIFKGSVRENLLMADIHATDEKLWQVLKSVNLSQFLKSMDGLDTLLLEKGSNFSGGQCQRLALARALLTNSDIFIFDEATSNIDAESEDDIMNVIKSLTKTKTVILISHRLLNVINSEKIYVLKEGEIAEQGSHTQLLKNKSYYNELWTTQQNLENLSEVI